MSAFVINRNNEVTPLMPELKRMFRTSNNTTAIYKAIDELVNYYVPELQRLKQIEKEHKELKTALSQRQTVDNLLKKFILEETKNEIT
ncbi:MAG: hypothetical protein L3J56_06685 [Bacteroidales bacterium]|nr:hypothetical protein [Bacteroidales bacterium]